MLEGNHMNKDDNKSEDWYSKPPTGISIKGFAIGMMIGMTIGRVMMTMQEKQIPNIDKVTLGYVIPSKIERILCEDLEHNGSTPETMIEYDGRRFLFKYDGKGLYAIPYEVKTFIEEIKK